MAYSPAFQFYYKDFRQDPHTIRMTAEEIGVYMLLIIEAWDKDNKLPNDPQYLADVAREPLEKFQAMWDRAIARCFVLDEKKNIFWQKRIKKEIEKQKAWSKQHSDAGKQGAAKRWKQKEKKDSTAIAPPSFAMAANSSSSSSSSSSSTSKKKEEAIASSKKVGTSKQGSRLPEDFVVSDSMGTWAKTSCPQVDIQIETEKFRNYYKAKAGRDATRLDWEATWRNWILNARDRYGSSNGKSTAVPNRDEDCSECGNKRRVSNGIDRSWPCPKCRPDEYRRAVR